MKKVALIPSYEPTNIIVDLAKSVKERNFEIVFVNDGSSHEFDEIFDLLMQYGHVISYEQNHGKGHALKKGLEYIAENCGESIVVTIDGDGQHALDDAERICSIAEKNGRCLVVGSRTLPRTAPFWSKFGNNSDRALYRKATCDLTYDVQSGLRAFPSSLIGEFIDLDGEKYEYEMSVLTHCVKKKIKIIEDPIEVIYHDKHNSVSHFRPVPDSFRIYGVLFRYGFGTLIGVVLNYLLFAILSLTLWGELLPCLVLNLLLGLGLIVLKSQINNRPTKLSFFGLEILNLLSNTAIIFGLAYLGMLPILAKIIAGVVLFFVDYYAMRISYYDRRKVR